MSVISGWPEHEENMREFAKILVALKKCFFAFLDFAFIQNIISLFIESNRTFTTMK